MKGGIIEVVPNLLHSIFGIIPYDFDICFNFLPYAVYKVGVVFLAFSILVAFLVFPLIPPRFCGVGDRG